MACFQSHYSSSTLISCTGPRQTEEEGKPQDTKNGVPRTWKKTPRVGKKCSPHHIPFELTNNLGQAWKSHRRREGLYNSQNINPTFKPHQTLFMCLVEQRTELGALHTLSRFSTTEQHPKPWALQDFKRGNLSKKKKCTN